MFRKLDVFPPTGEAVGDTLFRHKELTIIPIMMNIIRNLKNLLHLISVPGPWRASNSGKRDSSYLTHEDY
jgi:hypothetical protein